MSKKNVPTITDRFMIRSTAAADLNHVIIDWANRHHLTAAEVTRLLNDTVSKWVHDLTSHSIKSYDARYQKPTVMPLGDTLLKAGYKHVTVDWGNGQFKVVADSHNMTFEEQPVKGQWCGLVEDPITGKMTPIAIPVRAPDAK